MLGQAIGCDLRRQPALDPAQIHASCGVLQRSGDLGLLHRVGHAVPQALAQHGHQPVMQAGVGIVGAQALRIAQGFRGIQPLDQVPGRQVEKHPAGHLAAPGPDVAQAEHGHEQFQAQAAVEVCAAHVHARGGQNVGTAVGAPGAVGPQAHHREV